MPSSAPSPRVRSRQLLAPAAWQLLTDCVPSPRATLFVSPSARLARVPWGLLAMPNDDGYRLMELADVLMAAPSNIVHAERTPADWDDRRDGPARALAACAEPRLSPWGQLAAQSLGRANTVSVPPRAV